MWEQKQSEKPCWRINHSLIYIFVSDRIQKSTTQLSLFIDNNQIGDVGAKAIGEALLKNQSLTQLGFSNWSHIRHTNQLLLYIGFNQIGDVGANAIGEALRKNQSLTQLNLSNLFYIQWIGYNKITDAEQKRLKELRRQSYALDLNI